MEKCFLSNTDVGAFLEKLSVRFDVYFPVKKKEQRFYKKFESVNDRPSLGEVRPFEPLKAFFSRARECVAENFSDPAPQTNPKPIAIVGVKACDLKGMKVQDFVFLNSGNKDPFYARNREQNIIIGADCTCAIDTCFCLALGVRPYPEGGFDLNLSQVADGFLVDTGSEKGKALLGEFSLLFKEAPESSIKERDSQRALVFKAVEENIKKFDVPVQEVFKGIVERNFSSGIWEDEAKTCVECGACTNICPTCHCFLLYDQKDKDKMERLRVWDSCMIKDYARVAGGANPRKKLWMRLRNRFEKKFDFFPKVLDTYACTGCGRCISACPAKIDIRKVLRRLVANA